MTESREASDDDRFHLTDPDHSYTFAPGGMMQINHQPTGTVLADSPMPYLPLRLRLQKERHDLPVALEEMPTTLRVIGGANPTAIEYVLGSPEMLHATLRIERAETGLTHWKITSLSLSPHAGTSLSELTFPEIRGLAVGAEARDDFLALPGYAYHGAGIHFDPIDVQIPSLEPMAINWVSLYDQTNGCGLGLILDDQNDLDTAFSNDIQADAVNAGFVVNPTPETIPDALVLVHAGDWHQVADTYRLRVGSRDHSTYSSVGLGPGRLGGQRRK